jgi:hypothetical protein
MKVLLTLFLMLAWAGSADAQYVYVYVYGAGTGGGGCCPAPTPPAPSPSPSLYRPAYSYAPSGSCNGHQGGQRMPAAPVQYAPQAPQVGEYQTPAAIQYAPQYAPQAEPAQPEPTDQTQVAALLRSYQAAAPRPVYQAAPAVAYAPAVATYATAPVVYAQPAVGTYATAATLPRAPVVAGPRFRRGVSYGSAHTAAGHYGAGFARAVVCGPGGN